jgi:hypothetical protein
MKNAYCETLSITVPAIEQVMGRRKIAGGRPNTFELLVVALLEAGKPMTLAEVAERFAEAGVAPAQQAMRSLQRCRPARAPVYRDGDRYALDPHSDELDLMAFVLGLRPARIQAPPREPPPPRPPPDQPLSIAELDEGLRNVGTTWSQQRLVLAVLDAHRSAMAPEDVASFVRARTTYVTVQVDQPYFSQRGAAVRAREDGRWEIADGHPALLAARKAVRDRVEMWRRYPRPSPAEWEEREREVEKRRQEHAAQLGRLRRAIVHAFPAAKPIAAVLVDVGARDARSFVRDELAELRERMADYDLLAGVEIRGLLRALEFEPGSRRLTDLGPPQKTTKVGGGPVLRITTEMLVHGSCGIRQPFGDGERMRAYLEGGQMSRFRRRLEQDGKSLLALYEFGRTHGAVRLLSTWIDDMLPVSWVHSDEVRLYELMRKAHDRGTGIEAVVGRPSWPAPWARARAYRVMQGRDRYDLVLVDQRGMVVDERDIQLARLSETVH